MGGVRFRKDNEQKANAETKWRFNLLKLNEDHNIQLVPKLYIITSDK